MPFGIERLLWMVLNASLLSICFERQFFCRLFTNNEISILLYIVLQYKFEIIFHTKQDSNFNIFILGLYNSFIVSLF